MCMYILDKFLHINIFTLFFCKYVYISRLCKWFFYLVIYENNYLHIFYVFYLYKSFRNKAMRISNIINEYAKVQL